MGLIFDIKSAKFYDSWYHSAHGRAIEKFVGESIVTLLEPKPGERILDIGCGEGNHLIFMSKLGLDINGVDASPYMISRARERLGTRCTLKTGIAEELPFDDNEFDLAVLINTLEFLDEPRRALEEAGRVTKRKVFIGTMNSLSWYYLSNSVQGLFRKCIFNNGRFYSLWELKSLAQNAYGDVPIDWRSSQILPSYFERFSGFFKDYLNLSQYPFWSFIGLSATMRYWVKTEQHPLKLKIKKAEQSIARVATTKNLSGMKRVPGDERSLSV